MTGITLDYAPEATIVPGIVTGLNADNSSAINTSLVGGNAWVFAMGDVAIKNPIFVPSGARLAGIGSANQDSGALTTIVPAPNFNGNFMFVFLGPSWTIEDLSIDDTVNSYPGQLWDLTQPDWKLKNLWIKATSTSANGSDMIFDTGSNRGQIDNCRFESSNAANQFLTEWHSPDHNLSNFRHVGPLGCIGGNFQWTGGHITEKGTLPPITCTLAFPHFSNVVLDSTNAVAMISHTGLSRPSFDHCNIYQNTGATTFPIIHETNSAGSQMGVMLLNCTVEAVGGVGNGTFSNVCDNPTAGTVISGLHMQANTIALTGGVPNLWGSGKPGVINDITYNGIQQVGTSMVGYKSGAQNVAIGVSGTDGATTTIVPSTPGGSYVPSTGFMPLGCVITQTGATAGNTVTLTITTTYSDGSTGGNPTLAWTDTTGPPTTITEAMKVSWCKEGVYPVSQAFKCHVNGASTSLTLTVNVYGYCVQ